MRVVPLRLPRLARGFGSALLAAAVLGPALAAADEPTVVTGNSITLRVRNIDDPSALVASELWLTTDSGASWDLVARQAVAADAEALPSFRFAPPADGRYGFVLVNDFRDRPGPDPAAGEAPRYEVVFDRLAPTITAFSVSPSAAGHVVEWATRDPNPAATGVRFQIAPLGVDEPEWIDFGPAHPASGRWAVTLPASTHALRLVVRDRGGNQRASRAWRQAGDAAEPEPATEPAPSPETPTADPTSELSAAIAQLPEADPEPDAAAAPPAAVEPAAPTAAAPARPTTGPLGELDLSALAPLPPVVRAADRDGLADAQRPAELPRGALVGAAAEAALRAARAAVLADRYQDARELYRRLTESPLAAQALVEEVLLLAHRGRRLEAHALIHAAPAEARSARLALVAATLLLQDGDAVAAEAAAARIPTDSPLMREAQWITALALHQREQYAGARALLAHLASGSDPVARAARELLGR